MKHTVQAIILAAGKSTRFNTEKTKLAEPICGQPMILFSTQLLKSLEIDTTVVVGYEKETVMNLIKNNHGDTITFTTQEEQLGTGHALACSQHLWNKENILIINADMPLVNTATIKDLYNNHVENNSTVSFVSSCTTDQTTSKAYGRIVTKDNSIEIVEAKDFAGDMSPYCCINAGIYLIKKDFLNNYISSLRNNNASNEFYITDLIKIASENNKIVSHISAPFDTIRGINTLEELHTAEQIKRSELITHWMNNGVRFLFTNSVHLDLHVTIGHGSIIGNGVQLCGKTSLGKNSIIDHFSYLEDVCLDDNVHIHPFCILKNCIIRTESEVGPFTHVRDHVAGTKDILNYNEKTYLQHSYSKQSMVKQSATEKSSIKEKASAFSFIGARLVNHDIPSEEQ